MDIEKLSNSSEITVELDVVNSSAFDAESADISVDPKKSSRPVPEITAEIIKDMDNLCEWLHKVQKLHLEITRLRQQRMDAEIASRWAQIHAQDEVAMQSR